MKRITEKTKRKANSTFPFPISFVSLSLQHTLNTVDAQLSRLLLVSHYDTNHSIFVFLTSFPFTLFALLPFFLFSIEVIHQKLVSYAWVAHTNMYFAL